MKKALALCLALLMVFALVACGSSSSTSTTSTSTTNTTGSSDSAEPTVIEISVAHGFTGGSAKETGFLQGYFDHLEELLDGKYKFKVVYYPSGTLLAQADIYQGVVDNVVNMGVTPPSYALNKLKLVNMLTYPGVISRDSGAANARIAQSFYNQFKPEEMDDVYSVCFFGNPPQYVMSAMPITTVADFAAKKAIVRTSGTWATMFEAYGASTLSMSPGETVEAAQKGLVNATWMSIADYMAYSYDDVFPYLTYFPDAGASIQIVIMNKGYYESLPAEVQQAMDDSSWYAACLGGAVFDYEAREGYDYAMEKGATILYREDADELWTGPAQEIAEGYAKELDDMGLPGTEALAAVREYSAQYSGVEYTPWEPGIAWTPD